MSIIVANQISKRYGKAIVLDHVSFAIAAGESVALWGANGAGKTTTLRCLLGVEGFEGQLSIHGIDVRRQGKAARAAVGYVPQEASFYDMTILDTVAFYARLKKVSTDRIPDVLEQVRISSHRHKRVSMLSGGMKQRLALALALLADPPVLLLDEPTANLDVGAQRDFLHTIQSLNQSGKTIVFSSHRLDEVMALASRVLVLAEGRLLFECQPYELAHKLGVQRWIRIWIEPAHHEQTLYVLKKNGFTHMPNGRSVFVQVNESGKIAPLLCLQHAEVPVEDFDLLEGDLSLISEEAYG